MADLLDLRRIAERHADKSENVFRNFAIGRLSAATAPTSIMYEPMICLVLSGAKRIHVGGSVMEYGQGQHFISAMDMPILAEIRVDPEVGFYYAFVLRLDPALIAGLAADHVPATPAANAPSFGVTGGDPLVLDTWRRLAELLDRPDEIGFLAPLIEQELLFRLMRGSEGALLRQVVATERWGAPIRSITALIRRRYAEPISVEQLIEQAGMSASVFHRRFKAATGLSPLQYQKAVRLHEARRRLAVVGRDAAGVAYAVGYESASQFSREYKRLFGVSPRSDVRRFEALNPI